MPKLYIDEDGRTSVYEILEDEVTIGRGAANAVQLRDPRAGKHHALIRHEQGRLKLIDLETLNGTRVNGRYRNEAWLAQGDTVTIGASVLRLDLEGVVVEPPPATAAPAAPAAFAPAAKPAPPVARSAPPRPAAPARPAAPQRASAPAPARARAAPRRGREQGDAYYEDSEEDGRPVRKKKGLDSSVIVLVCGLGAVLLVVVMFLAMRTGLTLNKEVFLKADKMAGPPDNDYAAAIRYAEKHGDPGGENWQRLHEHIVKWKGFIVLEQARQLDHEASEYLKNEITRKTRTRGFRPMNALPNEEIAVLLKGFLERYGDSTDAGRILGGAVGEPFETFQNILRTYASADTDINGLLSRAKTKADALVVEKRYGAAIQVYENLEATQKVLLQEDLHGTLVQTTTDRKKRLDLAAREDFSLDMAAARAMARRGEKRRARARFQVMADTYGIPDLVTQAQDELIKLR